MNIENYKPNSKLTKEILKENNFRYIEGVYSYRFPVYKYKNQPIIWCIIYVNIEDSLCCLHVYDQNNNTYSQYFDRTYGGKNLLVESIDGVIEDQINSFVKAGILKKRGKK